MELRKLVFSKASFICLVLFTVLLVFIPKAYASGSDSLTLTEGVETSVYWGEYYDDGTKTWTSSDSSVVCITGYSGSTCYIKAVAPGSCSVVASVTYQTYETQWIPYPWGGGYWGVVPVTKTDSFTHNITVVKQESNEVATVTIDAGSPTVGDVYICGFSLMTASGKSVDLFNRPALLWSSSNPSVATVDRRGVIKALKKGTAVIKAQTLLGISGSCTVQVGDFTGYTAISTAAQLGDIRNKPDGNYYLTRDIVFSDADFQPGGQFYNSGAGFLPISHFYGVLNGRGHSIVNLYMNTTDETGLVSRAFIINSGTVKEGLFKNLEIRDSTITGITEGGAFSADSGIFVNCRSTNNVITANNAGGIVGKEGSVLLCANSSLVNGKDDAGGIAGERSYVRNCSNSGVVQALQGGGEVVDGSAGGIVGYGGNIADCKNSGAVKGSSCAGGIIGSDNAASIRFCVNTGTITICYGYNYYIGAGGIAGYVGYVSKIYDCFNTGSVGADANCTNATIGGICGTMQESYEDSANNRLDLSNCYNAGKVTSSYPDGSHCGGIAGSVYNSQHMNSVLMVKNCYYSNDAAVGVGELSGGAENLTALSASQMKAASSFAGFDFVSNWFIPSSVSYAYPMLTSIQMKDTFRVTFNSQGGSDTAALTALYNIPISAPAAPKKTGYTFVGWYKESDCKTPWNFESDRVLCDTTLYAKWIGNAYTVTFDSQGGSAVDKRLALYGSPITTPPAPTRTDYRFGGWYREAACTTAWNFASDIVIGNFTLYAKWTSTVKYVITAAANNTAWGTVTGAGTYTNGAAAVLKAIPAAGYRFTRWIEGTTTASTNSEYKFIVSKNRTLTAGFVKIGVPVIKAASAGYDRINITWSAVAGASAYEVYRYSGTTKTYGKIATVTAVSFIDTNLTSGQSYFYKVRVKCVAGASITYGVLSAPQSAIPVPAAPQNVTAAKASSGSIRIAWGAVPGTAKYEAWRCTTSASGSYGLLTTTASLNYTNTGLTAGKTYWCKVRAYRLVGLIKVYSEYSVVVYAMP